MAADAAAAPAQRTYDEEMQFIEQQSPVEFLVKIGMVPNMRVPGKFYLNDRLKTLLFDELRAATQRGGSGGFLPAVKQIANVAAMPGIVKVCHYPFLQQFQCLRTRPGAPRQSIIMWSGPLRPWRRLLAGPCNLVDRWSTRSLVPSLSNDALVIFSPDALAALDGDAGCALGVRLCDWQCGGV